MLNDSVTLLNKINTSLIEPINFEMSYIMQLKKVDAMIQEARSNFMDTLSLDKVEELFKQFVSVDNSKLRLEEIREQITLFVEKTSLVKRQDSIISTVEAREVDSAEKQ